MEAVIFCGIQAAGKSSFYRERFFRTHVRISLDLLRTRHRERLFLNTCLESGQRFVVDNTNPTRAERAVYIAAAKAKGVRFGRPPKPLPENFHSVYQRWKAEKITGTAAAKECGMPLATFRYRAEIYEKAKLL